MYQTAYLTAAAPADRLALRLAVSPYHAADEHAGSPGTSAEACGRDDAEEEPDCGNRSFQEFLRQELDKLQSPPEMKKRTSLPL